MKIGDKVRIKENFEKIRFPQDPGIIYGMSKYKGMFANIVRAYESKDYPGVVYYRLNIDGGNNLWFDLWLEEDNYEENYEEKIIDFCTKQCICECSEDCVWFEDMKKLTLQRASNSY